MSQENKALIAFYHKVGGLFYAVAAADKVVRKDEIAALIESVKKEWLRLESSVDQFGSDAALQIYAAFDWHLENGSKSQDILNDFEEYIKRHPNLLTVHVKKLIMETAERISASFAGNNKAELVVLCQISNILGIKQNV